MKRKKKVDIIDPRDATVATGSQIGIDESIETSPGRKYPRITPVWSQNNRRRYCYNGKARTSPDVH